MSDQSTKSRITAVSAATLLVCALLAIAPGASSARPARNALSATRQAVRLAVRPSAGATGYDVIVHRSPFWITIRRAGGTVLRTTAGTGGSSGPAAFRIDSGWASATSVRSIALRNGALHLTLASSAPGYTVSYRITPKPDRYRVAWTVHGPAPAQQVASHFRLRSAGHWYGQGETQTPNGGPYTRQPWPLDAGTVHDPAMGPAEYLMTDPFWFTERGTGLWVDTTDVMDVSLNAHHDGRFAYALTNSSAMKNTVFVERTAHDVYRDYIDIAGKPAKSDASRTEYAKPLWNSWAQFYTDVNQSSALAWAKRLHDARIPSHTIQIDDGWMTHYGDFTFNSKFPHPKRMSAKIHAMGDNLGLWVTLWINTDANNYNYAAAHGYLLRSKTDPSKPCNVTWWNGVAGIVDLANPAARNWYVNELRNLEKTYDVNGFKFDTRFFDESCRPYPGHTSLDYLKLGAQLTDEFDQQGAGVRLSWTGSQRYGFVIREIDKKTGWNSLQAGIKQAMSISTIGYPFVETDMIGGSDGAPPPTKQVLVRWAEAASLMPLMYSSTSPLGVANSAGTRRYDTQTVRLYRAAVRQHGRLAWYIADQVHHAVRTGEPIMKPLFFDFSGDRASYTVANEWLLGDSLLAAPVLAGGTTRSVHLPIGRWYDTLRGRVVRGPVTLRGYRATLGQTPAFVRMGRPASKALLRALGH